MQCIVIPVLGRSRFSAQVERKVEGRWQVGVQFMRHDNEQI